MEITVNTRKVNLLAADIEEARMHSYRLPIDSRIDQVTISISGDSPRIVLRDPHNPGMLLTGFRFQK